MPNFVLSKAAHVEAFPLLLTGGSAGMHPGTSLMEGEPSLPLQCPTPQEKTALSAKGGERNYVESVPGHPLTGQKLHLSYLLDTLNFS